MGLSDGDEFQKLSITTSRWPFQVRLQAIGNDLLIGGNLDKEAQTARMAAYFVACRYGWSFRGKLDEVLPAWVTGIAFHGTGNGETAGILLGKINLALHGVGIIFVELVEVALQ